MEVAVLMKEDLDTDFCNYVNYAIEQEELRLRAAGMEPAVGPGGPVGDGPPQLVADAALPASTALTKTSAGDGGDKLAQPALPEQRWLLVLRLVRRGVYALLAKDYEDDIKWVRYIIGLASPEARHELTERTLLDMTASQKESFANTVQRITDNLSVQRDARDLEIFNKVSEIKAQVESFDRGYSAGL